MSTVSIYSHTGSGIRISVRDLSVQRKEDEASRGAQGCQRSPVLRAEPDVTRMDGRNIHVSRLSYAYADKASFCE